MLIVRFEPGDPVDVFVLLPNGKNSKLYRIDHSEKKCSAQMVKVSGAEKRRVLETIGKA